MLTFHVPSAPSYLDRILDALARGLRDEHPARWKKVLSGGNITRFTWKSDHDYTKCIWFLIRCSFGDDSLSIIIIHILASI